MLSSRGCVQVLLGWALILGQLQMSRMAFPSRWHPSSPMDSCCTGQDQERIYEEKAERFRNQMEEDAAVESCPVGVEWKNQALEVLNRHRYLDDAYFTRVEDGFMYVEAACGAQVKIRMILQKTNCTREQLEDNERPLTNSFLEEEHCEVLEGPEQEQRNCTFTVAWDARSGHHKVIEQDCDYVSGFGE